MRSNTLRKAWS